MKASEFINEDAIGTNPKRPARTGSRPSRGHEAKPRYNKLDAEQRKYEKEREKREKEYDDTLAWSARQNVHDESVQAETRGAAVCTLCGKTGHRAPDCPMREGANCEGCDQECTLTERGKASRKLCLSSKPDADLGASNLSSCKSQGLRARDGEKSHKLGKSPKSRVKVDGKRLKGKKYGGPLPDWS